MNKYISAWHQQETAAMVSHGAQSTMFGSLTPQCIGVGITEEMCRLENVKKRLQCTL